MLATSRPPAARVRSCRHILAAVSLVFLAAPALPVAQAGGVNSAVAAVVRRGIETAQVGIVSWYGAGFDDRPTASGERFDARAMTMAHPTLPFGTQVRVTNLRNGRSVVVRVNDRGPHVGRRIADVSRAAAAELGMLRRGLTRARIEVLADAGLEP